jgi:N utilization substance protein B
MARTDSGEENMTRREIRDKIFKIVFTAEFNTLDEMRDQIDLAFDTEMPGDEEDDPLLYASVSDSDRQYITDKVMDIMSRKDDIDKTISEISEGWKLPRIGKEELAILRLGVYEVIYDSSIPEKVAINEAVELSKKYCDASASKFVNALLAKLVKKDDASEKGSSDAAE